MSTTPRLPEFITFTGLDARADLPRVVSLTRRYPIEWGVLVSKTRQGQEPRYPDGETLSRIWWSPLVGNGRKDCLGFLSAHICGQHARDVMESRTSSFPVDLHYCRRVQLNHPEPNPAAIRTFVAAWAAHLGGIAQTKAEAFPAAAPRVQWLSDRSAGTGQRPDAWPRHPGGDQFVGYAGGITPDNVLEVLGQIDATGPYWIDMESGVRTNDWLDLDKVEAVCRTVYGDRS